jgi:hypothetical protein
MMRGKVVWSTVATDPNQGSATSIQAMAGRGHKLDHVTLLAPVPHPQNYAWEVLLQVEGAAALRYPVVLDSSGKPQAGVSMGQIEVVWDNQFETSVKRASLTGLTLRSNDLSPSSGKTPSQAHVQMLSIAPGGIHVCPHALCEPATDSILFLRASGPNQTIPFTSWPTHGLGGKPIVISQDLSHFRGNHTPLALHTHRALMLTAHLDETGLLDFSTLAYGPPDAKKLGMDETVRWAYHQRRPTALAYTLVRTSTDSVQSWVIPIGEKPGSNAIGTPFLAPSQAHLSDPPAACTEEQRQNTYRIIGPPVTGSRHPVIIVSGESRFGMFTQDALLHGSPESACVSAFEAQAMNRTALIPVQDMTHSWLTSNYDRGMSVWPMSCQFQPEAKVIPNPEPPKVIHKPRNHSGRNTLSSPSATTAFNASITTSRSRGNSHRNGK